MPYETAVFQWEAGEQFIADTLPSKRRLLERVAARVLEDLRRRLGGPFTVDELVALYDAGTAWSSEIAQAEAPDEPRAWDPRVADAAFARYVREASDWAGGHRATS